MKWNGEVGEVGESEEKEQRRLRQFMGGRVGGGRGRIILLAQSPLAVRRSPLRPVPGRAERPIKERAYLATR